VLEALEARVGKPLERRTEPAREGDIRHSCADAGRARWVLGWQAETSLAAGLAHTWAWFAGGYGAEVATWRFPLGGRDGE
jgi:UDP-glucose 4-epimerase